jgi:hypothetical protein
LSTIKVQMSELIEKYGERTPVLDHCRFLIEEGEDPDTRLEVYREKNIWDIAVSNIGLGAKMTVRESPYVCFTKYRGVGAN